MKRMKKLLAYFVIFTLLISSSGIESFASAGVTLSDLQIGTSAEVEESSEEKSETSAEAEESSEEKPEASVKTEEPSAEQSEAGVEAKEASAEENAGEKELSDTSDTESLENVAPAEVTVQEPTKEKDAQVKETTESASSDETAESAEESSVPKTAEDVTQTVKAGKATITAKYRSDIFKEDVRLVVKELKSGSREYKNAEKKAVDKTIAATDADQCEVVYAYDISFKTKEGKELEPSDNVKISITFSKSPVEDTDLSYKLVHIPDSGSPELIKGAAISKDVSKVEFKNDEFSVYVVTGYSSYSGTGSYTIQDSDETYDTLAEAVDNVMNSGEIIAVSDDVTEEGGQTLGGFECRLVPGDKDITVTFDGDLTIDDSFQIGGINSNHKITVVVTGNFTLEDGCDLTIGKGGTLKLNPDANNSLAKTDVTLEDDGKIEGYTFPEPVLAFVVTAADDISIEGKTAYETLAEAVAAANSGDVILVTADTADSSIVKIDKDITLRAYDKDVTLKASNGYQSFHVVNGGKLHLGDGTASPTLTIQKSKSAMTVASGGTLEINDGVKVALDYNGYINPYSGGTVNVTGGIVEESSRWNGGAIEGGGTVNVSGGTVSSNQGDAIRVGSNGHAKVSGGRIEAEEGYAAINLSYANAYLDSVSGGIIVGGTAIKRNSNSVINKPQISGGEIKALDSSGYAFSPKVTPVLSGSVKWLGKYDEGSYTVAEGYEVASDTTTASLSGDFHYLSKQVKVTYDGNGGKTADNKTEITRGVPAAFEAAENEFLLEGKVFKEWNTKADGTGDGYAEGAEVTISDDTTLFAIWDTGDGSVLIRETDVVYNNIREAMAAAEEGQTIVVTKNVSDTTDPIVVDKTVTLIAGDSKVTSSGANLKVSEGKTLTLGDGTSDNSQLTLKGSVSVTNGKVVLRDGVTLRKELSIAGAQASGTVKGGKVTVGSGNALSLTNGAAIDEISGGEFITGSGNCFYVGGPVATISGGKFVANGDSGSAMNVNAGGVITTITGADTLFQGSGNGNAISLNVNGVIDTIENGKFLVDPVGDSWATAVNVQGKLLKIKDGHFEGGLGLQFGGEVNGAPKAGCDITGGTFIGKGASRGNGINIGQYPDSPYTFSISNAAVSSKNDFGIIVGYGNHVTSIDNVTSTGDRGGLWLYYGNYKTIKVDEIKNSTIEGVEISDGCVIGDMNDNTLSRFVNVGGGYYDDKKTTVKSITGGSVADSFENNGIIDKIEDTKFTCTINNTEDGEIKLITGETSVKTDESYGINNEGTIGTIESGDFEGGYAAMYNSSAVDSITGGNYTGNTWFGIWNNGGTIGEIAIPKGTKSVFKGPWGGVGLYNGCDSVSGYGIFMATDGSNGGWYAIGGGNSIETAGKAELDLATTKANPGYGRYFNAKGNAPESELPGATIPAGYHMSVTTTTVDGVDGDFRYLVKDNTVIYDGNGHALTKGTAPEGFENQIFQAYESSPVKVADNDYSTGSDFSFNIFKDEVRYDFTGWNTKADGSGTAYAPDADLALEGKDVTLYAQWKEWVGPVNINHGKMYETIEQAMKEARDGDVIYVRGYDAADDAADEEKAAAAIVEETAKKITVDKNVTIVADPNSPHQNPISQNAVFEVSAGKILTMGDPEKSNKTLTLTDSQYTAKGTMILNDNTEITQSANKSVISVNAGGTLEVNGGSVTADKGRAVYNNGGTAAINKGTLTTKGSNSVIENRNNGTLTVKGGTITGEKYTAIDNVKGTITELSGGTIKGGRTGNASDAYRYGAVRNESNGTIDKITGDVSITANSGVPAAVSNEGAITLIDGGTINGVSNCAFYNGKTAGATIGEIKGGTFRFADTSKGTAFQSDNGTIGTISGGTFKAMAGIVLNGGTIEKITGNVKSTSTTSAALKIMGGLTVPEISGGTFEATETSTYSLGLQVAGGSTVTKITKGTFKGLNGGIQLDTGKNAIGTISGEDTLIEGVIEGSSNANGIYLGQGASIGTITKVTIKGKDGIRFAGGATEDKAASVSTIDGAKIESTAYGIHLGSANLQYGSIGTITGKTSVKATSGTGIYLVNEGASIGTIDGIHIDAANGAGISNQGGTITEIVSAEKGDVTIKSKDAAIHNYNSSNDSTKAGSISSISGYGIYESESASAIVNAKGAKINLESTGTYDLNTEKPNVGYGSYKSGNSKLVIDDANNYNITDGYAMSKITHDDGYYHLVRQFKVTFDPDEGTPDPDDQVVGYNEKAERPGTDPSKTGFSFINWFKKIGEAFGDLFDFDNDKITEDTDLKAKYNEHTYTIAFDGNASDAEGTTESITGVKYTDKKNLTENGFTRAGYDFNGWNRMAHGSGSAYADKAEVEKLTAEDNATVTMYAQWTPRDDTKYVVKHLQQNIDDDEYTEVEDDRENLEGTTDTEVTPGVKTYDGFTSPEAQTVTIKGDGSTVVEYRYDRKVITATFDSNGGEAAKPESIEKKFGSELGTLPTTERTGYTFDGWFTAAEGGDEVSADTTMPAEKVTYYAHWTINQYKVAYKYLGIVPDGASRLPAEKSYDYSSSVEIADPAAAAGYTFSGWSRTETFRMPAEDVEITGTFTAKGDTPYRVEHYKEKTDGTYELADTENLTGKTDTEATANPKTYEGFTLNEKAEKAVPSGKIAADGSLVLKLYYDRNMYEITFDPNGGEYEKSTEPTVEEHKYGDVITMKAPTREGYTFRYWKGSEYYEGDEYVVIEDHKFEAQWKKNKKSEKKSAKKSDSKKTSDSDKKSSKTAPAKTGDNSSILLYGVLALLAAAALAIILAIRRRCS